MQDAVKAWDIGEYTAEMRRLRKQVAYAKAKLREAAEAGEVGCCVADRALKQLENPDGAWVQSPKPAPKRKPRVK